ncbi:hypothetical protein TIFTF001_019876 [Ficus carica]|uniref:Uncharacterized protein n=1 Tax=Ficus carica TaxID=3494 RepID=A0AA88DD64_FICCA|nr:hypothetical protein TIFTF001_019876 [Ficus carica]
MEKGKIVGCVLAVAQNVLWQHSSEGNVYKVREVLLLRWEMTSRVKDMLEERGIYRNGIRAYRPMLWREMLLHFMYF